MTQKYMIINVALCHDCNNCFMGCKDEFVGNDFPGYSVAQPIHGQRWMNILRRERGVYSRNDVAYLPMPCQHCENAPCIEAGNGAVTRRQDGIVMIDTGKVSGNKELADSCPYGAIYFNEEADCPQKCTMCAHLLDDPEWGPAMPRCAHNCPTGALAYVEAEPAEIEARIASGELSEYRAELGTKPHVLYKNLYRFTKNFVSAGILVDGDCFEGAKCILTGTNGEEYEQETNFFGEFKFDGLEDGKYILYVVASDRKYYAEFEIAGESLNLGFIKL
jgi:Fe-S-cluster-containing dehydrogenase component